MKTRWALITGGKGSGRSRTTSLVVDRLAASGISVGGVIQEAVQEDGERIGYHARRVGAERRVIPLARRGAAPVGARPDSVCSFCSFVFDGAAFAEAGTWVREAAAQCDVVIVDEVSKLEVAKGGHHDAIVDALDGRALVVLVVRADQLFAVVERFGLEDAVATLDAGDDGAESAFIEAVARAARVEGTSS